MTATKRTPCGFCSTGHHKLCPGTIRNGSQVKSPTWTCPCSEQGHTLGGPHREAHIQRLPASALPARTSPAAPAAVEAGGSGTVPAPAREGRKSRKGAPSPFPAGVCSPYRFRGELVGRGLVPASFRPQTVYMWVTKAARGGTFPVRYYSADGAEVKAGEPGARPGVPADEAAGWVTAQVRAGSLPV